MKLKTNRIVWLAILCTIATLFTACGGGSSSSVAESTSTAAEGNGVLRVGMECAYAPFNWTQLDDANGAVALADGTFAGGYDVEIARRIAEKLDMQLEIVKTEWDGLPPSLTSGKIDVIIAGMSDTAERRETIGFSSSYYTSDLVMVVMKEGPFATATGIQDFSGAKITGQLATLHYDVIDQIQGVDKQQAMKDFPTMVVALSSGKVDGYVSERPGALSAVASNPNLTFVDFADGKGFDYTTGDVSIAIGIRKEDTELQAKLDKALAEIPEEERQKIMEDAVKNQPMSE